MTMMTKAQAIARYVLEIAWPEPVADDYRVHPDTSDDPLDADFVKPAFGKRKPLANQEMSSGLLLNP